MKVTERTDPGEVAPGIAGYRTVRVASTTGFNGHPYEVEATVRAGNGKYSVVSLVVHAPHDGVAIHRGELAKISVEPYLRAAAETVETPPPDLSDLKSDDLAGLAQAYRWIRLREGKPSAALAEHLGVSLPTVRRWITNAVEAGYLTQEERTK
ncbi:helix-turn-helix domain-containing protein [Rhodococcus sp. SJ-2]